MKNQKISGLQFSRASLTVFANCPQLNQWLKLKETESLRKAQILHGWCKNSPEKQIKMLQSEQSPKFIAAQNIPWHQSPAQVPHCSKTEWIRTQPREKAWHQRKGASCIHRISVQLLSPNSKSWWKLNFKLSWNVSAEECLMGESRLGET